MSTSTEAGRPRLERWRWPAAVLVACLGITVAVTAVTYQLQRHSERELLAQQTGEASAVLTSSVNASAASLRAIAIAAAAVDTQPIAAQALSERLVANGPFEGVALVDGAGDVISDVGDLSDPTRNRAAAVISRSRATPDSIVIELDDTPGRRRLLYAVTASAEEDAETVFAEAALPEPATGAGRTDGPFSDIDYAIYLGSGQDEANVLSASADHLPVPSPRAVVELPYGDTALTFVATAARPLSGRFAASVPWILAIGGLAFTALAVAATVALTRGRRRAERLANQVAALYQEQRERTDTLRRSLLPRELHSPPGVSLETRYWPADTDNEISGDFFDAFRVSEGRWAMVVGDVCGKGVDAAALTGLTRHTIRAAAAHTNDPSEVLRWAHDAIAAYDGDTYVTACFAYITPLDGGAMQVDLSLGGHPQPALCSGGEVSLVGASGSLLGMFEPRLQATRLNVRPGDTLVMYTDGLTDSSQNPLTPEQLVDIIRDLAATRPPHAYADAIHDAVERRRGGGSFDDTAILVAHIDMSESAPLQAAESVEPASTDEISDDGRQQSRSVQRATGS